MSLYFCQGGCGLGSLEHTARKYGGARFLYDGRYFEIDKK